MKKVVMVGTGNIFENVHCPIFRKFRDECEISAVCDVSGEKAESAAEKYDIPHFYTDAAELFAEVKPDMTVVCVPAKYHSEVVLKAISSGSHVLCEKPPAINKAQAREMADAAKDAGLVLAYNLQHRHSANVSALKAMADYGRLGNIYNARVCALRRRGVPGWGDFISKAHGGGPLIDIGIHMLDTALYLLGYPEPQAVMASSYSEIGRKKNKGTLGEWNPEKYEVEDSLFAHITFKNGLSIQLETSFALNIKEKDVFNVWLRGSEAGASVYPLELYGDVLGELTDTSFPFTDERGNYSRSIRNFIDRCGGKDAMTATGEEGFILQELIENIYKSAETGGAVIYD